MHGSSPGGGPGSEDVGTDLATDLGTRDVCIWLCEAPEEAGAAEVARAAALISADERARMSRFRFEADRRRYLFAHALVRTALTRHAPDTSPEVWRFRTTPYGRPEIETAGGPPPLRFNLSHTAGLVACAVTRGRDVGVDVEHVGPPGRNGALGDAELLEVARRVFAPAEVADVEGAATDARRERFFAIWTLKEAYIKARGLGLHLPLERFAFRLDGDAVRFEPDVDDDDAAWCFTRARPTPGHALALAARRTPGEALAVRTCRAPLAGPCASP
jgi:4'-phosphopantetheinyl transferase